jgi:hypothetical protein
MIADRNGRNLVIETLAIVILWNFGEGGKVRNGRGILTDTPHAQLYCTKTGYISFIHRDNNHNHLQIRCLQNSAWPPISLSAITLVKADDLFLHARLLREGDVGAGVVVRGVGVGGTPSAG